MQSAIVSRMGDISTAQFMRHYWQRKPLLIRQALPEFSTSVFASIKPQAILAKAREDEAPSRLIEKVTATTWRLSQGPLDKTPSLKKPGWTVLLQAANTVFPELAALMHQFRFISDARLDDLMVSVASDGGGVGPHLDSYDVFLLQARGQRHWRWGKAQSNQLQPSQPLKLLSQFNGGETALLEPGDMLYLPAGWAHDGIAKGQCMTYSIGFRASTQREIVGEFFARAADSIAHEGRQVRDRTKKNTRHPAKIPSDISLDYQQLIRSYRPTPQQMKQFVGEHLSEPPAHVFFHAPEPLLTSSAFAKQARQRGLALHHASRALYDTRSVFLNGQCHMSACTLLRRLFNQRDISPGDLLTKPDNLDLLYEWYCCGWILLK